jgi:hypothetical protein
MGIVRFKLLTTKNRDNDGSHVLKEEELEGEEKARRLKIGMRKLAPGHHRFRRTCHDVSYLLISLPQTPQVRMTAASSYNDHGGINVSRPSVSLP